MEIAENIDILEYEWLGEEDGSVMMAAENSWRGLAVELNELHFVKGAAFVEQLRNIVYWGGFRLVEGETNIFRWKAKPISSAHWVNRARTLTIC